MPDRAGALAPREGAGRSTGRRVTEQLPSSRDQILELDHRSTLRGDLIGELVIANH
ncbi:hypothetical protein G5V58_11975 [Nocardioides anomalus]|uniref:Uncharacterized protein n=1 Tax=Nocardioides anomalus TaxID=2712223 RepID=A0A6G6WDI3_9ACTN|nr:hypothetical protein [Nocardioides anomalus]QIG43388.1 hypothetical protein G5V58_11975 [Nocardioides anomalus]